MTANHAISTYATQLPSRARVLPAIRDVLGVSHDGRYHQHRVLHIPKKSYLVDLMMARSFRHAVMHPIRNLNE